MPQSFLYSYLPVLLFMALGIGFAVLLLGVGSGLSVLLKTRKPYAEKNAPYECGFDAFEDARIQFDVRYYLIAILFILFDLEVAFLLPWSVIFREVGMAGFWAMMIFLSILVVGFLYEWKKGALEWE